MPLSLSKKSSLIAQSEIRAMTLEYRVGGNQVYVSSSGNNNEYLHIIMGISEGPIEGIETIYLDDKPSAYYGGLVYYEVFNGAGDQPLCTTLQSANSNWNDYQRYTAYLYIRLQYDGNVFATGLPKISAVVRGRKLYDPRNSLTVYSNNPALVWRDFMTNARYGLGIDQSFINDTTVIDAANWCETQTYPYTFNGILNNKQAFLDNIMDMMLNFRADIIWSEGKYKLSIRKYETSVMSLTEDDILADSFTFIVPGTNDTPNRIIAKYAEENSSDPGDVGWTMKNQVVEDTTAVLTYDNEERDLELALIGTTNLQQANLLAIYSLERYSLNKSFSFLAHPKTLSLEPGDVIDITHTLPGWTGQDVRIIDMGLTQDGVVSLAVQEENAAMYDDTLNLSSHTYFSTNLPNVLAVPPEATNVSFNEEEYYNKDVSYTRLKITFTNPASPFWAYSEVWINIDNTGYNHYVDTTGSFYIQPVKEGVSYKIKLLSVSINGIRAGISTATEWSYNVIGLNTPPDDVTNFRAIPQSDTIILMWDAVNIVDLQGYEIRKGTNWGGGIFIGFTRALTFQLNGVAPGTHSYMIKSVDTNAKYSNNFTLATATVYGPASYTEKMSQYSDFNEAGETHYNTERYVDPTYGPLLRVNRQNSITNYDFETDTVGWTLDTGWTRSNALAYTGSYSIASPANGSGANSATMKDELTVVLGETYRFRAYVWSNTANQTRLKMIIDNELTTPITADGTYTANGAVTAGGRELESYSAYHPGDSGWRLLEVLKMASYPTFNPRVSFRKEISTGQAYFDNCSTTSLSGTYTSPVYDRASSVTRRSWPEIDNLFFGTGTAWWDHFTSTELWTDEFSGSDKDNPSYLAENNEELYQWLRSLGQEVPVNYAIAGDIMIFKSQDCIFPGIYLGSEHLLCTFAQGCMVVPLKFFRSALIEIRRVCQLSPTNHTELEGDLGDLQNPNTYFASSDIHGEGLFAGKDFDKDETVCLMIDLALISKITKEGTKVNHLSENCNSKFITSNSVQWFLVAQRPICKGEEITVDYHEAPNFINKDTTGFFT